MRSMSLKMAWYNIQINHLPKAWQDAEATYLREYLVPTSMLTSGIGCASLLPKTDYTGASDYSGCTESKKNEVK